MANLHKKLNKTTKLAIFSSSLLVAASAAMFIAPVIRINAAEESADVNVNVNPIISLTLSTSTLSFDVTPTVEGSFNQKPLVATVDTNSTGGYELYFSSEDSATAMTSLTSASTITSDFSGTVTSSTMANNKWGYSLNTTNFSKIPALADQAKIKDLDHFPTSNEKDTTVNIATKIDNSLPSGTYSKRVLFTAVAHQSLDPSNNMQGFNCSSLANVGDSVVLTDSRDGNEYTVKKLKDGKCWMIDNLRISDRRISSADSNLPNGETWDIPASSISGFSEADANNVYIDNTYGGYYTFYAATAGWGTTSLDVTRVNSPKDICPKGWRLPTGSVEGEYYTLYEKYNTSTSLQGEPGFTLSGFIHNSTIMGRDEGLEQGNYWSSTADYSNNAYRLFLNSYNYASASGSGAKICGYQIRCVVD